MTTNTEHVICGTRATFLDSIPSCWNLFENKEAADTYAAGNKDKLDKEYDSWAVMSFDEYRAIHRKHCLSGPLKEITEEQYDEMLNVLPPMAWGNHAGVNVFLMSEFFSASFTNQYARWNGRYFTRMVDAYDKSTWITAKECARCAPMSA